MSDATKIEWADASWNPIRAKNRATGNVGWFCVHKSAGCKHCYAEPINHRLGTGVAYKAQNLDQVEIFLDANTLMQPLRWRRARGIFPCSMSDLFGEFVTDEQIDQVFAVMALCPQHTFFVLTKRSERMRAYIDADRRGDIYDACEAIEGRGRLGSGEWPLRNVWLGVSCEDQETANERIPHLLDTRAAMRWVSAEPLLGPIDFATQRWLEEIETDNNGPIHRGLDWIVVGGESGPDARPMCAAWARDIRDRCDEAGVAFFFKQWGAYQPRKVFEPYDTLVRAADGAFGAELYGENLYPMQRLGKKAAGRLLDGREYNARPPLAHETQEPAP
jgi:protein gp37